jgi:cyanate lyase
MVDKISRLSHEVDTAREDFKVFLNGLQQKGTSTDVILCILYEAVNIFENIVKEEVQKTGADKDMSINQFLDLIKEKARKNSRGAHNWLGRSV